MTKAEKSKRSGGKRNPSLAGMYKMDSNSEAKTMRHRRLKEAAANAKS